MAQQHDDQSPAGLHVCPADRAWVLTNPIRRLIHRPEAILAGLVQPGQTAVDLGCGPGYFTLPMARLVGPQGRVVAVDVQQAMLDRVRANAAHAGLLDRIALHLAGARSLGLRAEADFALAFYMVHEVPDARAFLAEVAGILAPDGRFLVCEPVFHVSAGKYRQMLARAEEVGLQVASEPRVAFSRSVLLTLRQ